MTLYHRPDSIASMEMQLRNLDHHVSREQLVDQNWKEKFQQKKFRYIKEKAPLMDLQFADSKKQKDKKISLVQKLFGRSQESKFLLNKFKKDIRVLPQEFSIDRLKNYAKVVKDLPHADPIYQQQAKCNLKFQKKFMELEDVVHFREQPLLPHISRTKNTLDTAPSRFLDASTSRRESTLTDREPLPVSVLSQEQKDTISSQSSYLLTLNCNKTFH